MDDSEGRVLDIANNVSSEQAKASVVRAGAEWKLAAQVVDVPQEANGLAIGVYCLGRGEVWADDLQLEIVNRDVPLTSQGQAVTRDSMSQPGPPSDETKKAQIALQNIYKTAPEEPRNLNFEEVGR